MRGLPIEKAINLGFEEWIYMYQTGSKRNWYQAANMIYEALVQATGKLNIRVEEPYWIELENERDMTEIEEQIQEYIITGNGSNRFPKMLVMILGDENLYDKHKQLYKLYQIPSQIVRAKGVIMRPSGQ